MKTIFLRDLYDAFDLPGEGPSPVPHVIADNRYGYALRLESGGEQIEVTDEGILEGAPARAVYRLRALIGDASAVLAFVGVGFGRYHCQCKGIILEPALDAGVARCCTLMDSASSAPAGIPLAEGRSRRPRSYVTHACGQYSACACRLWLFR